MTALLHSKVEVKRHDGLASSSQNGCRGGSAEWPVLISVLVIGWLILFSRRPDVLLNAQFYIEDGLWYSQAHEMGGLSVLFHPFSRGYLTVLPRLGAWIAQPFPLAWAPAVMNGLALASGALPAVLIASRRFETAVPNLSARLFLAFVYLSLPGTWTTIGNITHSMWHFGMLSALVVIASPPRSLLGRIFDVTAIVLSGLTGPICIFLMIVVAAKWWHDRTRWSLALLSLNTIFAFGQGVLMIVAARQVSEPALTVGAGVLPVAQLFARRIVFGLLFGEAWSATALEDSTSWMFHPLSTACAVAFGIAVLAYATWRGPLALRLLILFGLMVFAGSIAWPPRGLYQQITYIEGLSIPGHGNRYFVYLLYAFAASLVWLAAQRPLMARTVGIAALSVVLGFGIRLDWLEPPLRDLDFARYVKRYERAEPGQRVQIVHPPGWSFVITKR